MSKNSKKFKEVSKELNLKKLYTIEEAINIVKKCAIANFNESIDINVMLGIDGSKQTQVVRSVVTLPNGTGKTLKVAVFAKGDKAEEAKKAGADIVGAEDLIETIQKGNMPFDRCVATPDMMILVGKVGKLLGPKGLMPNPKLGTVTNNVSEVVRNIKVGQVEFKSDKAGIVRTVIGKVSFENDKLIENIKAFIAALNKAKPQGVKGVYLKKMNLSSTMGPGVIFTI